MLKILFALILIFISCLSQANPVWLKKIDEQILNAKEFKKHCHVALQGHCFWHDEIFLINYKENSITYAKKIYKNNNDAYIIFDLHIKNINFNKITQTKNYTYDDKSIENFKRKFDQEKNPYLFISDFDVFWQYEKKSINDFLHSNKITANASKLNLSINRYRNEKISIKLKNYLSSYDCPNCVLSIIKSTVLGYLIIDNKKFAILGFLEEGIEAGPPVVHVEFFGL